MSFLPHQPKKTAPSIFELIAQLIIKCHQRHLELNAKDPAKIIVFHRNILNGALQIAHRYKVLCKTI